MNFYSMSCSNSCMKLCRGFVSVDSDTKWITGITIARELR